MPISVAQNLASNSLNSQACELSKAVWIGDGYRGVAHLDQAVFFELLYGQVDTRSSNAEQVADVSLRKPQGDIAAAGLGAATQRRQQVQQTCQPHFKGHRRVNDHALLQKTRAVGHLRLKRLSKQRMAQALYTPIISLHDQDARACLSCDQITGMGQLVPQTHHSSYIRWLQIGQERSATVDMRHADFKRALNHKAQLIEGLATAYHSFALAQRDGVTTRNKIFDCLDRAITKTQRLSQARRHDQSAAGLCIRSGDAKWQYGLVMHVCSQPRTSYPDIVPHTMSLPAVAQSKEPHP